MRAYKRLLVMNRAIIVALVVLSLSWGAVRVSANCVAHCWHLVPSYNGSSTYYNGLHGVVAISPSEVWAVGYYYDTSSTFKTLAEKWDGSSWQNGNSLSPSSYGNSFEAVATAPGDTNIWAVGEYEDNTSHIEKTLIERYIGSLGGWSVVASPNKGSSYNNYLSAVAGTSASDYWAVGDYWNSVHYQTLIEHWDGSSWSIVTSPNHGSQDNHLLAVTVIDSKHAWAVGDYLDSNLTRQPLLLEWDGVSWSDQSSALPTTFSGGSLAGVSFANQQYGFAVGGSSGYQYVGPPAPPPYWASAAPANNSQAVAYLTATSAWAVGYTSGTTVHSTTSYWNGTTWATVIPVGSGAAGGERFNAVSGLAQNDTWAVGSSADALGVTKTYIEHYY